MGLKESGLRGSLRSTSSVLPAFFDVTITNTNSPVQEGDILTVDYSADNTGDAQDMQDIRLEIDSVQEDVDPGVMLAGGASTTGTLEWDTTGEPEAEYTAAVLSNDDSDSVIVEIGSAIPDAQDLSEHYQFYLEDGSLPVSDQTDNNRDLDSGGFVGVGEGINGVQAGEFDGSEFLSGPTMDDERPSTIHAAIKYTGDLSNRSAVWNLDESDGVQLFWDSGNWRFFDGEGVNGSTDDTVKIITVIIGESEIKIRENGVETGSATAGNRPVESVEIGGSSNIENWVGAVGEWFRYPQERSAEQAREAEEYLANQFKISLD